MVLSVSASLFEDNGLDRRRYCFIIRIKENKEAIDSLGVSGTVYRSSNPGSLYRTKLLEGETTTRRVFDLNTIVSVSVSIMIEFNELVPSLHSSHCGVFAKPSLKRLVSPLC